MTQYLCIKDRPFSSPSYESDVDDWKAGEIFTQQIVGHEPFWITMTRDGEFAGNVRTEVAKYHLIQLPETYTKKDLFKLCLKHGIMMR